VRPARAAGRERRVLSALLALLAAQLTHDENAEDHGARDVRQPDERDDPHRLDDDERQREQGHSHEEGDDRADDQDGPAGPRYGAIATMRSIGTRARSAISAGTSTTCESLSSASASRSFGSVIIFM
jgi:hypothetical protein